MQSACQCVHLHPKLFLEWTCCSQCIHYLSRSREELTRFPSYSFLQRKLHLLQIIWMGACHSLCYQPIITLNFNLTYMVTTHLWPFKAMSKYGWSAWKQLTISCWIPSNSPYWMDPYQSKQWMIPSQTQISKSGPFRKSWNSWELTSKRIWPLVESMLSRQPSKGPYHAMMQIRVSSGTATRKDLK